MLNKSLLLENVAPARWKWNDWVWVAFSIAASCLCPNFFSFCSWHSDGQWSLECHQWTVNPKKNLLRTRAQHLPRQAGLRLCQLAYPVAASHSRHHGWFLGEKPFGNCILHEIHYIHCSIPCRHCRMSSRPTQCPGWIKPQATRRFHKILPLIPTDYEYSSHIVIKLGVKPISRAWN